MVGVCTGGCKHELPPDVRWDEELDHLTFDDEESGLPCVLHRSILGVWLGYVGLPGKHMFFGMGYDEINYRCDAMKVDLGVELTYGKARRRGILAWVSIKSPFRPREHWVGFDCAHVGQEVPGIAQRGAEYITCEEAYRQTYTLARAMAALLPG